MLSKPGEIAGFPALCADRLSAIRMVPRLALATCPAVAPDCDMLTGKLLRMRKDGSCRFIS